MSEQGGVRPDLLGTDFTGEMAAGKAAGEAAMHAQMAALEAVPGVGALMDLTDNRLGSNLREVGADDAPRVGEGLGTAVPDAPNQSGGRPHYASNLAGEADPFLG